MCAGEDRAGLCDRAARPVILAVWAYLCMSLADGRNTKWFLSTAVLLYAYQVAQNRAV